MRLRLLRTIAAVFITLLVLSLLPIAIIIATAWTRRLPATRLLAAVKQFDPGSTSEAQAREALKPFSKYENQYERQGPDKPMQVSQYDFFNVPKWPSSVLGIPTTFLPWTLFTVNISYRDGLVVELDIVEMQEEHPGYPHPDAASVRILSSRYEDKNARSPFGQLPEGFNGYNVRAHNTGKVDKNGNWTGFSCCGSENITLDERASADQRNQSLNFQLSCLTSVRPCNEPRKILPIFTKP